MNKAINGPAGTPLTDQEIEDLSQESFSDYDKYLRMSAHARDMERESASLLLLLHELKREMEWCLDWAPDDSQAKARRIMKRIGLKHPTP